MFHFLYRISPILLLCSSCAATATADWVVRSDSLAKPLLQNIAKYSPEKASFLGEEQYDVAVADLKPGVYKRMLADLNKQLTALRLVRKNENDSRVQQDLDLLIASCTRSMESMRLHHQHLLNYIDAGKLVYGGLREILDARNKPARQAHALTRLRRYAGMEAGYTPITVLARARMTEELKRKGLIGPYADEINESLNNTESYLQSIADLFKNSKLEGWEENVTHLSKQIRDYNDWARVAILPRARSEAPLPPALYKDMLKNTGVDITPQELIERAAFDYQEVREQIQMIANVIAAKHQLPSSDWRDVIKALKKRSLAPAELIPHYQARVKDIEAIIRRENLITLPEREVIIRTATEGEAASIPAPFMNPPRLIGNTGEYGEFVIPLTNPNAKSKAAMDDFNYDAVAWTLSAHEARPGHELQFASMVEQGTSIARAYFAFNSVNTEGWGVYSEAMLLPFMPAEGQLVSLQLRLLRIARAFLDPMVNLGQITPAQAKQFLIRNLVLSEPFAQAEVDRYAFKFPGQATAYYYGYVQLRSLKTQIELMLGDKFNQKAFNDFIIQQGLLPPVLLKKAMLKEFVPSHGKMGYTAGNTQ